LGMGLPVGFESVVSPDELERAGRFSFEDDRHRHLLSSYATREVLSRYLRVSPGGIPIAITAKGKPHLKGEGIRFSVSHSRSVAVVAVARARVGVDVEEMDTGFPHAEVAERFFSEEEAHAVRAEADPQRRAALFFSYWTRKEALLKASGEGLHADLKCVDFSAAQKGEGSWMDHGGARWAVAELGPERGVFCSLALEGELRRVERYVWEPLGQQ
jgi:4'-phosphopantetheinyl transferase